MRTGILLLVYAACGLSQPQLTPSITAGIPITDTLGTFQPEGRTGGFGAHSPTRRYLVGGTVALDLTPHVSLKAGIMYRPFGYDYDFRGVPFCPCFTHYRGTGASWEVPMLARWRVLRGPVTPFAELGGTFRRLATLSETTTFYENLNLPGPQPVPASTSSQPQLLKNRNAIAPTVAAGIEFRSHRTTFAPEIRYTRWHGDTLGTFGDPIRWNWQRLDFLLEIGFSLGRR